ncbi:3-phosphoserine/phosphohydroxythreonine transaminase [Saprospira grandis]|uniref:3-phosphoserine/phosphohydroxythreonine transaminase n=1 Tax=Saprospira grandis TaxID=1008 RepID=UPI0022DCF155|nr:3-phosphoserine/phosphohydroxythreonine transaminase [Saprospira grandis]WBM73307.1 3-phosphoserine/phosphohydroxythreonine transaminase [Saprospira grandis]
MKKHNFSAGPAILPATVLAEAAEAVKEFGQEGLSILEMSHRSKPITAVVDEARDLVRELLELEDDFEVLFLTGGASSQFFMVPMNLLGEGETAAYIDTGTWSTKAIKEAKNFGEVVVVGSSADKDYTYIPKACQIPAHCKYLHITTNNTVRGSQFHHLPERPEGCLLVADMSSDIFSCPIDANQYDLIYAGAQKNLGPAGVTLVIVRKSILGNIQRQIPTMLDYQTHVKKGSMFNTPPVYPIYVSMLTLRWIQGQGGLKAMQRRNKEKADLLYQAVEAHPHFRPTVAKADRSIMNACFVADTAAHEAAFLAYCEANGISGLKGHRSVGGFRASMYNAMDLASVQHLVDLLNNFKP